MLGNFAQNFPDNAGHPNMTLFEKATNTSLSKNYNKFNTITSDQEKKKFE